MKYNIYKIIILMIIILIYLTLFTDTLFCAEFSQHELRIKEELIRCLSEIIKDNIFIERFGRSSTISNYKIPFNIFYNHKITGQFVNHFMNTKQSLAIISDKTLSTEEIFICIINNFYDQVEQMQSDFISWQITEMAPAVMQFITDYLALIENLEQEEAQLKHAADHYIKTEGAVFNDINKKRAVIKKALLDNIIKITIEGDNTCIMINIQLFIVLNFTYKKYF